MPQLLLTLYIHTLTAGHAAIDRFDHPRDPHDLASQHDPAPRRLAGQRGQATTEYALVLLAAAMVALLVIAWATAGGGAARITRLFNGVIDAVIDRI